MSEGIYVRSDRVTDKYEIIVNGLKAYEFKDVEELHGLAMQLVLVLGYSLKTKSGNVSP